MSCAWLPRCLAGCALAVTLRVRRCRPYIGLYELHLIRIVFHIAAFSRRAPVRSVTGPRSGRVRRRGTVLVCTPLLLSSGQRAVYVHVTPWKQRGRSAGTARASVYDYPRRA